MKTKGRAKESEVKRGNDGSFWYVSRIYRDLMVCSKRSSFEMIEAPCREIEKSCKCGIGYLSDVVTLLRARQSPHAWSPIASSLFGDHVK